MQMERKDNKMEKKTKKQGGWQDHTFDRLGAPNCVP